MFVLQAIVKLSRHVRKYVLKWLKWNTTWQDFHSDFLRNWGARYAPGLKNGQWWLWITSIYIHRDLQHIISNMLLFVVMSVHLELNYGWWRMLLVWFITGMLLTLLQAAASGACARNASMYFKHAKNRFADHAWAL